jgi:hypothetical protein
MDKIDYVPFGTDGWANKRRFENHPEFAIREGESFYERGQRIGIQSERVTGRIGYSGEKIHNLIVEYVECEINGPNPSDKPRMARVVFGCWSYCGSQRWTNGRSPLFLMPGHECDCKKCNR